MRKTAEIQRRSGPLSAPQISQAERAVSPTMSPIILDQPVPQMSGIHPVLRSFAEECRAILVRMLAYICGLAILATIVADLLTGLPTMVVAAPAAAPGWSPASRPHPAFAISQLDLSGRTDAYATLRRPEGGRKDILRWAAHANELPTAEIEIYRMGSEVEAFAAPESGLAERAGLMGPSEAAGLIDTKFGPVALVRLSRGEPAKVRSCLGFAKSFDGPKIRISGWSCQGDTPAAQRAHLTCTLNRLTLLSAGNEPKIAELFARAELNGRNCPVVAMTPTNGWIGALDEPRLRGAI